MVPKSVNEKEQGEAEEESRKEEEQEEAGEEGKEDEESVLKEAASSRVIWEGKE